uniref:Uncharacterized protein n=1 Tax=Romanomermis culicivorax TaxID=13658 RepID=A0A915IT69_ROMCU
MDRLSVLDRDEYFPNGENSDENSEIDDNSSSDDEEFGGQFLRELARNIDQKTNFDSKFHIFDAKNCGKNENEDDFEQDMEKELSSSFELFVQKKGAKNVGKPPKYDDSNLLKDENENENGTNSDE